MVSVLELWSVGFLSPRVLSISRSSLKFESTVTPISTAALTPTTDTPPIKPAEEGEATEAVVRKATLTLSPNSTKRTEIGKAENT